MPFNACFLIICNDSLASIKSVVILFLVFERI
uniref:Uncharacterized protein n=1 Tax=Rhizophora mucronata TaxID=61149 RepID=A0A2P2NLK7_RHIMU